MPVGQLARPEPPCTSRARRAGRSSDLRAQRLPALPTGRRFPGSTPSAGPAVRQARPGRLSFPLTAAGQSRVFTGFPLSSTNLGGPQNQLQAPPYVGGPRIPSTICRAGVSGWGPRGPCRPGPGRRISRSAGQAPRGRRTAPAGTGRRPARAVRAGRAASRAELPDGCGCYSWVAIRSRFWTDFSSISTGTTGHGRRSLVACEMAVQSQ
jgi:hypothetical protein